MEAQGASPDQARDTIVSFTKTAEKGEIRSKIPFACHFPRGAPVVQNTKYASLFRRLGSLFQTNVLRIQSIQSTITQKKTNRVACSQSSVQNCVHQTRTAPSKEASSSMRPGNAVQDKMCRGQSKRKAPNPAKPTEQLRADPAGTSPCWKTRVIPLRMWAGNTRPQWPEDTEERGS